MGLLQDILVAGLIIVIMLAVGLDLTPRRFVHVFRYPFAMIVGLVVNHVAVPLVALGLSHVLALSTPVAIGLIICAATPGGPVAPIFVQYARGDLALTVSLVVVMTLINVAAIPLTLELFHVVPPGTDLAVDLVAMGTTIGLYVFVPLAVGMAVRQWLPKLADRALPIASKSANGTLGIVIVGLTITEGYRVVDIGALSLIAIELCILASIGLGLLLTPGGRRFRAAVSLTSSIRNLALALLLISVWFDDGAILLTAMTYGLLMMLNAAPASALLKRRAILAERASSA